MEIRKWLTISALNKFQTAAIALLLVGMMRTVLHNIMDYWYKLLYYWCREKKPIGYGLSIPFIVGAKKGMTLQKLLLEISTTKSNINVILRYCDDINKYVLSLYEAYYPVSGKLSYFENLFLIDDKLEKLKNLEQIICFLEGMYLDKINKKQYSKDTSSNAWKSYSKTEKKLISEIIKNNV